ncbi:hypothetical protein D9615_010301 [Tricholomella constricta]|uniref:Uncharacterized protein n=1 Tax=Tricholomella constricta TaxID=117010 RepID=A0A8H5GP47_9AGAR|nr:hypothetical protein D9615_010301 [Tricholomella constricta]
MIGQPLIGSLRSVLILIDNISPYMSEKEPDPALPVVRTYSSIAPTASTTNPNPFLALKGTDARRWPQDLTIEKEMCSPLRDQLLPRGGLPKQNLGIPPLHSTLYVDKIRTAQQTGDTREILRLIPDLLDHTVRWLCNFNEVNFNYDTEDLLLVADIPLETALCARAAIDGIPAYHYTDAHHRHAFRTGKRLDEIEPPYTEQDADRIDILDLLELLLLAQSQMSHKVPTEWNGGNYTVHMIYPTSTLTQLIVITAHIPHETAFAVQEGHPTMKMVKVTRDIINIDLQADDAQFIDSDLFKVLVGIVQMGIKVGKMTPYYY